MTGGRDTAKDYQAVGETGEGHRTNLEGHLDVRRDTSVYLYDQGSETERDL